MIIKSILMELKLTTWSNNLRGFDTFDNIGTSVKNLVFFLRLSPKLPTLIHNVYLESIITYLQNFTRVICAVVLHQHPIFNGKIFPIKILIKHNVTKVSSVAGNIPIILNASPLETFKTLSLSGPCVLIQCNFTVFAIRRIWCQCSDISSDFFSISSDDTKKMLMFRLWCKNLLFF